MWLRKRLNRLNHWMSLKESQDPISDVFWRCQFECLDPKLFQRLVISKACVSEIEVDLVAINLYTKLFQRLAALDLQTVKIDLESIRLKKQTVTIETFFRDPRGFYLDSAVEVQAFKQRAFNLIKVYKAIEHERLGVAGYNARLLRTLLSVAARLANDLRLYSLQQP